jgi:Protein of unknown function (DUF3048) N-terminal domain/Protein of unknown function (DUF3048) C-terminal domain/Bacterial Ig-like domain
LTPSTFKPARFGRWRPLAIGAAGLVIIELAAGVTLLMTDLLLRPPTAVNLNLRDGQREVGLKQSLNLTFTRPVAPDRVESSIRIDPSIDGALKNTGSDHRRFSWTASGPWTDLTTYTVSVLPFPDGSGIATAKRVWHFTTTIVPRVTSLTTENGTATGDGSELPIASKLKLAFNAAMAPATVKLLLNGTATDLAWSDDGKLASFSATGIPAGGLDVGLGPGGKDQLGHLLDDSWKLHLNLVFAVTEHTIPLTSPALIQIPNDNYGARDQSGLQAASIAFEYVTEGGITRLSALFTNVPDVVGPVRSGRLISFKLTRHYRGLNYFSGLSAGSFGVLQQDPVPTLFDTQGVYYRSQSRVAPNNLYINGSSVKAYQDVQVPPYALVTGTPQALPEDGATSISVPEHNSTYAYEPATGTYLKTEDGHLMSDALVNQPLHIQLLVVMHTSETITNIVEDVGGGHGRDFDTESGGAAEIYFQGKKAAGRWSTPNRNSPFVFTLSSGQVLTLPKNLVWVDIVS